MTMNKFQALIGRLTCRSVKRPSLEKQLGRLMPPKVWQALSVRTPDRRELLSAAARELNTTDEELLVKISKRMGLPTMTRLPGVEGQVLDAQLLQMLRSLGAYLLFKGTQVDGVACVDPSVLVPLDDRIRTTPIYLAPWRVIDKALQVVEAVKVEETTKATVELDKKKERVAREVLELIVKEVENLGASKFYLERFDGGLTYSFKVLSEASLRKGRVHPQIAEVVWGVIAVNRTVVLEPEGGTNKLYLTPSQLEAALIEVSFSDKQPEEKPLRIVEPPEPLKPVPLPEERLARVVQFPAPRLEPDKNPVMLIVEDNVDFARVLTRYFRRYPIDIVHYTDGEEAFRDITEGRVLPSLTICDLHMPTMPGLEFLRRIRMDLKAAGLPVIMLTSDDELETQIKLVESGADVFLAKSTHPRVLEAHVRRILNVTPQPTVAA